MEIPAIGTGQAWGEEGLSFSDPDPSVREKAIERINLTSLWPKKLMQLLLLDWYGGLPQQRVSEQQAEAWMVEAFKICTQKALQAGVRLAVEPINRYETSLINSATEGLELINKVGADNLGLLLDTFHMNIEEPSIEESINVW